ncbi:MAG: tRNA (N6-isopentenyl adenosine(37)-C2)-methylthiotransferase MiaB [Clostridia bacterium]|nr:tRNA (N6-isopentenyl adenosine(37)-C2)-methylthiotransferase MiaB [Clostridia bacterium]
MNKQEVEIQKEYIEKIKEINKEKNLKYYILTMGCQLNENDSEKIVGMVEQMGYTKSEDIKDADIYLINTCCVRENAEEKLFGKVGELKKIKERKNVIIAIGGCMMQEEHITKKLKESYNFIDIIFGTHTLHKLPEDIYRAILKNEKIKDVIDIDGKVYEGIPIKRTDNKRALVTIMYGCNNFCTYCIVPYVRGRERSRNPEDILKEVQELANEGYKEITLLGQNVNSYNGGGNYKFANLLEDVCKIDGIEIIRFVSPHPKDFTDDVIKVIKQNKKIARLIHVPLQSGSTEILKKMNRKYTKEQYLDLIARIKKEVPEASISTDIIVGFPGETEEDFEDTMDVARKVNFEQIFMFIYSRRVGTIADKMEDQIPEEIKHKRFDRLKALYEENVEKNNKKYVGTIQKILVEGYSKTNEKTLTGRTDTNKVVIFDGSRDLIGKIINVKIVSEHKWYLKGEI